MPHSFARTTTRPSTGGGGCDCLFPFCRNAGLCVSRRGGACDGKADGDSSDCVEPTALLLAEPIDGGSEVAAVTNGVDTKVPAAKLTVSPPSEPSPPSDPSKVPAAEPTVSPLAEPRDGGSEVVSRTPFWNEQDGCSRVHYFGFHSDHRESGTPSQHHVLQWLQTLP